MVWTGWTLLLVACVARPGADGGDGANSEAGPVEIDAGERGDATAAREDGGEDAASGDDAATIDATVMDAGAQLDGSLDAVSILDGDTSRVEGGAGEDGGWSADVPVLRDAACGAMIRAHPILESPHVETDASTPWNSNPPTSGPHFGIWARWGTYTEPIPRGYLVHSLEHGAVVLSYRCANRDGCPMIHDRLAAFVRGLPPEPACVAEGLRRRIILTPDPLLDTLVAGAAWGFSYRADCVDEGSLETFVLSLTGRAPEDFCADGFYPPIVAGDAGADGGD